MGDRMEAAFEELREAIFEAYAALMEEKEGHTARDEHERRRSALDAIDEILNWQPLASFSATISSCSSS
jgi:hypothetical protein